MALNFNTSPYFDDYDETKNFHRVLFKPGVAVQARELTQLQTILQDQVSRFGKHIFKEGSLVLPGNTFVDKNVNYIKLQSSYNSEEVNVDSLLGRVVIGQVTGVRAKVISVSARTDTDPATIFVKYIDSGLNFSYTTFNDNETLLTSDNQATAGAITAISGATGKTLSVSINAGIYFIKGAFVRVENSTIILDKYSSTPSYKVGLDISESVVNSDDDVSLLDPAVGTYNYFAPGADRYRISLTLTKRGISESVNSDIFLELLRIENGEVTNKVTNPGYNILADELARRTFDESGNYTVSPFSLRFIEHLKDTNNPDGVLTTGNGGNSALAVAVIGPGKAYVRGYEIESINNKYISINKARDFDSVNNAIVRTPVGNYVFVNNTHSIPDFTTDLKTVQLYNRFTEFKGTPSGTLVGNAKTRGFETTGNIMLPTTPSEVFLFDVQMDTGYTFNRDVKQLYVAPTTSGSYTANAFTGDVVPQYTTVRGTANVLASSNIITGINSFFTTDLKNGDYIIFGSNLTPSFRVLAVNSASTVTLTSNAGLITSFGLSISRLDANIVDTSKATYLYTLPVSVTKNISDVTYRTRRVFYGTLAAGSVTFTAAVGETFASVSDTNYFAVISSGASKGNQYRIASSMVTEIDSRNWTFNLSTYGFTNQDVLIYTTIIKSNPTVKPKTSTVASATYTTEVDCKAATITIPFADVYELSNVTMCANAFGTAYSTRGEIDITDRFTFDTGQRATYYGLGKVIRKSGSPEPSGPIKINFKYYTHGSGDFFRQDSYPDYNNIPTFTENNITYNLRDCLDYRPRINNAGTGFSGTGASINEFIDFNNDYQADLEYYLPRIDKIYITAQGNVVYKEGSSSISPVEPIAPDDCMPIYIIDVPAYTFDIKNDLTIRQIDQKRYTMRDIGKLETRIKNLEYYTSLSLLEVDTALFTIKDKFGLSRYKNGFIVDSFTGHSVGDVYNPDYNISMDFSAGHLRPGFKQVNVKFAEVNTLDSQRTANGYVLLNNSTIALNYTDELYISSTAVSTDESVNPFDVYTYTGTLKLSPPGDIWYQQTEKPLVYKNDDGSYDTLIPDAVGQQLYGTIWNSWKTAWYESSVVDNVKAIESGIVLTESNVTADSRTAVIPYMRAVTVRFNAAGLKPNTKMYAFFDNYNVTPFCYGNVNGNLSASEANVSSFLGTQYGNLFTDEKGQLKGAFEYNPDSSKLKITTGVKKFTLTSSSTNSNNKESFATQYFTADGTLSERTIVRENYRDVNLVQDLDTGDELTDPIGIVIDIGKFVAKGQASPSDIRETVSAKAAVCGISTAEYEALLVSYNPGVYDYNQYIEAVTTPTKKAYTSDGTLIAGTDLWSSGYVQDWYDNIPDENARDVVFTYAATVHDTVYDRLSRAASGDTSVTWSDEEVKWYQDGVANGSFGATDIDSIALNYAAAFATSYAADQYPTYSGRTTVG